MKLQLSEGLFDDFEVIDEVEEVIPNVLVKELKVDDEVPATPQVGAETGVANLLIDAINDEWETISKYNDLIANLQSNPDMVLTIQDIVAEENTHVGQLQKLLLQISPNVYNIQKGEIEAEEQLQQSEGV